MKLLYDTWIYVAMASPYLLFGLTIAGFVHTFISMELVQKKLGTKSISAIFKAALFGVPLPLCSCSVIPTAVTLKKNGASNAATSSFLISTPETGIDSIAVTYALMDLPMTLFRPIAAFLSASIAGLLQFFFNNEENQVVEEVEKGCCKSSCCGSHGHEHHQHNKKQSFAGKIFESIKFSFGELSDDIASWLSVGLIIGGLITFFIPENFFGTLNPDIARFAILLIGIPLYICASASTPIAASLLLKGMSPGAALLFLLVGPATNVSTILVMQKYIGKKGVVINVATIAIVSLLLSYAVDYIYQAFSLPYDFSISKHMHEHKDGITVFHHLAGAFLTALLVKGVYIDLKEKFSKK